MNDDLKPLFDSYRPELGDADEYIERLQRKMETLRWMKQQADEQRRLFRRWLVVAFATGAVLGTVALVCIMLHPLPHPAPDASRLLLVVQQLRPALVAVAVAGLSALTAHLATNMKPSLYN